MKATGTRPKIIVSGDGRGVVGHAGARLLTDVADAAGLTGAFSEALSGSRQRRGGHDPGQVAVDLAVTIADGGQAIADLAGVKTSVKQPTDGSRLAPDNRFYNRLLRGLRWQGERGFAILIGR